MSEVQDWNQPEQQDFQQQDWNQPQQEDPQDCYQPEFSSPPFQQQPIYSPQSCQQPMFSPQSYEEQPVFSLSPDQGQVEDAPPAVIHIVQPQFTETADIEIKRYQTQNPESTLPQDSWGSIYTDTQLFTIKVFCIVTVQLIIVASLAGITYISRSGIREAVGEQLVPIFIAVGIFLIIVAVLLYTKNSLKGPWTYVLMVISTLTSAYLAAAIASSPKNESLVPLFAVCYTLAVTLANTLYAFYREADYVKNFFRPIIVGFIVTLILVAILCASMQERFTEPLAAGVLGVVYSIALPIMMAALIEKHQKDQYIIGSVKLFVFITIFWLLLLAQGGKKQNRYSNCRYKRKTTNWFGFF